MLKKLMAVAASGLALSLAACGGTPTDPGSSAAEGETSAAEQTPAESTEASAENPGATGNLTMWVSEDRQPLFEGLGEMFEKESGVSLDITVKPNEDLVNDFIAQVPSGEAPDIIITAHDRMGDLLQNGVISPVELGDASATFTDIATKAVSSDGQLYGVPYATENLGLVRNNEIVQDTPETFDELVEQGKGTGKQFPIVIQQGEDGDPYHLYPLQTSFGSFVMKMDDKGDYVDEVTMGGEEGEKFAEYLKKLGEENALSTSIGGDQAKQAFMDGNSPYMITGPWMTKELQDNGMDISVLPIPSAGGQPSAPFVGVQAAFVNAKTENGLLANQFMDFLATEEAQEYLQKEGGRFPALKAAADSIDDEILKGFGEAGKDGQPMPATPGMAKVWTFWGKTEASIISGAAEPKAAWQEMIKNIEG